MNSKEAYLYHTKRAVRYFMLSTLAFVVSALAFLTLFGEEVKSNGTLILSIACLLLFATCYVLWAFAHQSAIYVFTHWAYKSNSGVDRIDRLETEIVASRIWQLYSMHTGCGCYLLALWPIFEYWDTTTVSAVVLAKFLVLFIVGVVLIIVSTIRFFGLRAMSQVLRFPPG